MRTTMHAVLVTSVAFAGALLVGQTVRARAQQHDAHHQDLSGRWTLNHDLSENAQAKLESMHGPQGGGASQGAGHHGGGGGGGSQDPSHHGGAGSGGGQTAEAEMAFARDLLLDTPSWFIVRQDAEHIVFTNNDGRVRTLTPNGRKEHVNGHDVRTRWDGDRLVGETSLKNGSVNEVYEPSPKAPQLVVTTTVDMSGQKMSVRRVYDADHTR